jgi:hypothetical protein
MSELITITIAQQINDLHQQAEDAYSDGYRRALEYALSAGRLLTQQKAMLDHGQWKPWVEANLTLSVRRAQEYMQLAEHTPQLEEARASAHLSIEDALRRLRKPRPPKPTASDATALLQGLAQPSGERPGGHTDAARRADPREAVAAPSQPETHRPSGTGNPPPEPWSETHGVGIPARVADGDPVAIDARENAWDDRAERKHARALEAVQTLREALEDAHSPRLSPYAIADTLRTAERDARQLVSLLSDLAFTFER